MRRSQTPCVQHLPILWSLLTFLQAGKIYSGVWTHCPNEKKEKGGLARETTVFVLCVGGDVCKDCATRVWHMYDAVWPGAW